MNASLPDPQETPPPRDVLAGEYVLGVLDARERRAAEQRIDSDAAFAAAVTQWQQHLMPLADEIAPVAVPERVWVRIRASLGLDAPAPRAAAAAPGFWESIRTWRWLSAGGFATAAACMLTLMVARPSLPPQTPTPPVATAPADSGIAMTSTLMQDDGKPGYVVLMDADKQRITLTPLAGSRDAARVPELWLIPADGKARSMGVFDDAQARATRIPDALMPLLSDGALLAVTMEPPGGAPGGVATGPIVAKGGISTLRLAP
ncbi:anti-sigma factor [Xanthomonas translucens]|uniref:anti-sigma factor n=1 Tax=Xanthomonas campestris pv. translucens TaxID=343 RepID=UPI00071E77B4|nr:anti-sigma factor [Xanthomonas translucens]